MTLLNNKFDVQTIDSPIATAALEMCLPVASPPSPSYDSQGTPVAGTIQPGSVVMMNAAGKLIAGEAPDLTAAERVVPMVAFDGNVDKGGSLVQVVTCLLGGVVIKTDQVTGTSFTPGLPLTFSAGKFKATTGVADVHQRFGYVGPEGYDATNGVLHVIIPQGV
jgi:hypothetical protein